MSLTQHNRRARVCAGVVAAGLAVSLGGGLGLSAQATDPPSLVLDKATYQDRIAAMWLGEILGWGMHQNLNIAQPWAGHVDHSVEYLYLMAMTEEAKTVKLTGQDIRQAWTQHITGPTVWQSDAVADLLMGTGAVPPATSSPTVNQHRAMVDTLIGQEAIGALAPGRPDIALDIAQLPIRTVSGGYGASMAQFEVLLYSLAPAIPANLAGAARIDWLLTEALKYLSDDSITKQAVTYLMNLHQANPTWTVDQLNADFRVAHPTSASPPYHLAVAGSFQPLAAQVIMLLVSQGDLSNGWEAMRDAPTAQRSNLFIGDVMASTVGVFGLMLGTQGLEAEVGELGYGAPSHLLNVNNMQNVPDYLPADLTATDSVELLAARSLPLLEQTTLAGGGTIGADALTVALVDRPADSLPATLAAVNPDFNIYWTSANAQARAAGNLPTVTSNLTGATARYTARANNGWRPINATARPSPSRSADISVVADGLDADQRGVRETTGANTPVGSFFVGYTADGSDPQITVTYPAAVQATGVRLYGGDVDIKGGWINAASVEVDPGTGVFAPVAATLSESLKSLQPYQQIDLVFPAATTVQAVRVTVQAASDHLNLAEVDTLVNTAYSPLVYPRPVTVALDLTELGQALEAASWLRSSDYTAASWQRLSDAVAAAAALSNQVAIAPASVTQTELDAASTAVQTALNALTLPVDWQIAPAREALAQAVQAASKLSAQGFTADSWQRFSASLKAAKAVLANATATAVELRGAASALALAGTGLQAQAPTPQTTPVSPSPVPSPSPSTASSAAPPPVSGQTKSAPPAASADALAGLATLAGPRLKLAQPSLRLVKGTKAKVPAAVYQADGSAAKVTWKSLNKKTATVSKSGTIKARKVGKAVLTVKAGKDSARLTVWVVAKKATTKVKSVKLTGLPSQIKVGAVAWAEPVVKPAQAVGVLVKYSSSVPAVLAVTKTGRVQALSAGTAVITVKAGGQTKAMTVIVH